MYKTNQTHRILILKSKLATICSLIYELTSKSDDCRSTNTSIRSANDNSDENSSSNENCNEATYNDQSSSSSSGTSNNANNHNEGAENDDFEEEDDSVHSSFDENDTNYHNYIIVGAAALWLTERIQHLTRIDIFITYDHYKLYSWCCLNFKKERIRHSMDIYVMGYVFLWKSQNETAPVIRIYFTPSRCDFMMSFFRFRCLQTYVRLFDLSYIFISECECRFLGRQLINNDNNVIHYCVALKQEEDCILQRKKIGTFL